MRPLRASGVASGLEAAMSPFLRAVEDRLLREREARLADAVRPVLVEPQRAPAASERKCYCGVCGCRLSPYAVTQPSFTGLCVRCRQARRRALAKGAP